jgi:hypothetical protein
MSEPCNYLPLNECWFCVVCHPAKFGHALFATNFVFEGGPATSVIGLPLRKRQSGAESSSMMMCMTSPNSSSRCKHDERGQEVKTTSRDFELDYQELDMLRKIKAGDLSRCAHCVDVYFALVLTTTNVLFDARKKKDTLPHP